MLVKSVVGLTRADEKKRKKRKMMKNNCQFIRHVMAKALKSLHSNYPEILSKPEVTNECEPFRRAGFLKVLNH